MVPTVRLTLPMGRVERHRLAASRAGAHASISSTSRARSRPWSWVVMQRRAAPSASGGHVQDRAQVEPGRLPVVDGGPGVERLDLADGLGQGAEPELGQQLAHLLGDVLEEGDHELGLAAEALAQLGVLGGHADRAGVEVADPHHHAARHHQRGGGEAELLGAEQGGDHHVAAGLQLAVDLHHDAVAQPVEQQRLLGLGQAQLPGGAGVLERGQRRGAGAAVVARDEHHVGVGLGHARRPPCRPRPRPPA